MKNLLGVITSQKNLNTVTVKFVHYKSHPKYKKIIKSSRNFKAHFENINLKVGDVVTIIPSRPFSATKRFLVIDVKSKVEE